MADLKIKVCPTDNKKASQAVSRFEKKVVNK